MASVGPVVAQTFSRVLAASERYGHAPLNFADFKTGQSTMRAAGIKHKDFFTRDPRPTMAAHSLRSRWVAK